MVKRRNGGRMIMENTITNNVVLEKKMDCYNNNNERARLFTKMRRAEFMEHRNWHKGLRERLIRK